jgi:DNA repair protein RadC
MNHSIKQSIKAWPQQERPRERLLEQGASSLSDAELLAIFLRSGSRQHSAVELARLLIQHFGGLNPVFDASQEELCQFHGMGATKYSQLMAVKELGRRYLNNHFHQDHLNLIHLNWYSIIYVMSYKVKRRKYLLSCVWTVSYASYISRNCFLALPIFAVFQSNKPCVMPFNNMLVLS